jgi:uncharacterized protein GlcG (DUF336 family)
MLQVATAISATVVDARGQLKIIHKLDRSTLFGAAKANVEWR